MFHSLLSSKKYKTKKRVENWEWYLEKLYLDKIINSTLKDTKNKLE